MGIHAQIANKARKSRKSFNDLLQHYGMGKVLYRLSRTEYAENLVLKGGLIFFYFYT